MPLEFTIAEKNIALERSVELQGENTDIDLRLGELSTDINRLSPLEALNRKIFNYHNALVRAHEDERRAIDGRFPENELTEEVIDQAARAGGILFPEHHADLPPLRVVDLDGGEGHDPANEIQGIEEEIEAIDHLLNMPFSERAGSIEEEDLLGALAIERNALIREIDAIQRNENLAPGSSPHDEAMGAFYLLEEFLLGPDLSNTVLQIRRSHAGARRNYLQVTRLPALEGDLSPLYKMRYSLLDARVNLAFGTRTRLLALEDESAQLTGQRETNVNLGELYEDLGT